MVSDDRRNRPAPHHMPHGEIHENNEDDDRGNQPLHHLRCFRILQGFLFGLKCCPASSPGPGGGRSGRSLPADTACCAARCCPYISRCTARHQRLCPVAGVFNSFHNIFFSSCPFDCHGVCQEGHCARRNARHLRNRLLHMHLAGGAGHAADTVLFHHLFLRLRSWGSRKRIRHALCVTEGIYFINFCSTEINSSIVSSLPSLMSSTTQDRMCSAIRALLKELMAEDTAEAWTSTSGQ